MKNRMFFVLLGALCAQTATASPQSEKNCVNLGVAPYGDASSEAAWRKLGLTSDQIKKIWEQTPRKIVIDGQWPLAKMISKGGKILRDVRVCGSENADLYILDDGKGGKIALVRPEKCNNWSVVASGVTLRFRTAAPVVEAAKPAVAAAPKAPIVAAPKALAVLPKASEEKAAGSDFDVYSKYKWQSSKTSRNESGYVEGTVWDGDFGVGALASKSFGHSLKSKSEWDIDLIGVQLGFKGGKSFKTEDGRTEKELWQIKPRLGYEHLETIGSKGLPDRNQKTILAGAYVENLKTDGNCLYGWVGGFWIPVGTSVNAGKEAEDRTSVYAHLRRECRIDKKWSWRVDGGPDWSAVSGTALSVAGQLRYRTESGITFFVGPQLGYSFEKSGFFWAGFVGAQFGGTDSGVLHNQYMEDHKVTPTGRIGAEVFAPVAQVQSVQPPVARAMAMPQVVAPPQDDREYAHYVLEAWWAALPKK